MLRLGRRTGGPVRPCAAARLPLRRPLRRATDVRPAPLAIRTWILAGGGGAAWNHDLPRAEQHLALILRELTLANLRADGSRILALDDPELFNYPIAFMWEPGFWNLTDREAVSFRAWLNKGGFAVFEDFDGPSQWSVFEAQMRRVLPEGRLVRLDQTHPIFDTFFRIQDINAIVHPMTGIAPSYYGIFEDNDPSQRLMVVANFDNDVPEYLGVVG